MKRLLKHLFSLVLPISLLTPTLSTASDQAKEQRWSDQIVDSLLVGDPETLKAGDNEFLALYAEAEEGPGDRAVILLHGMGIHPDWPEIIHPLRSELPAHGWATLAIQLPVLPNDVSWSDYVPVLEEAPPRIQAAIAFLQAKDMKTIVLVGHSLGASMGCSFLQAPGSDAVGAFVGVGMPVSKLDPRVDATVCLEAIEIPVFDLYGSRDQEAVNTAPDRRRSARRAENQQFRQFQVEGADHFFNGLQDELVRQVRGWLRHLYPPPRK